MSDLLTRRRLLSIAPLVVLGVAASSNASHADDDLGAGRARTQAQTMYEAFLRGDVDTFIEYTHPKLVKLVGGKPKIAALIKKLNEDMRAKGVAISSVKASPPQQIVRGAANSVQAILSMELVLEGAGSQFRQPSFLLGLSNDSGTTWKFVDTGQVGAEQIRKLFPECSPALKIPSRPEGKQSPK